MNPINVLHSGGSVSSKNAHYLFPAAVVENENVKVICAPQRASNATCPGCVCLLPQTLRPRCTPLHAILTLCQNLLLFPFQEHPPLQGERSPDITCSQHEPWRQRSGCFEVSVAFFPVVVFLFAIHGRVRVVWGRGGAGVGRGGGQAPMHQLCGLFEGGSWELTAVMYSVSLLCPASGHNIFSFMSRCCPRPN